MGGTNRRWWSNKIEVSRRETNYARRKYQRCRDPVVRGRWFEEFKERERRYRNQIMVAKIQDWTDFIKEQEDNNIWRAYRATKGSRRLVLSVVDSQGSTTKGYEDTLNEIVNSLYREGTHIGVSKRLGIDMEMPPLTYVELGAAVDSFNKAKAPGQDGITVDVLQEAMQIIPETMLILFDALLRWRVFPRE